MSGFQTYHVYCLSEAMSPISHMSGTVGNEAIIAREAVVTGRGTRFVPVLSGNALRHRCVREPGALWLIGRLGLRGKLTRDQLNFLLHGGSISESTAAENTGRIARIGELFPLLKLLGGCLPNQVLSGSLNAWRGTLVCEENRRYLTASMPEGMEMLPQRLQSAEVMVGNWQYTRQDSIGSGLCPPVDQPDKSQQMIFSGQSVNRHGLFFHGFVLDHVTHLELGALLWSLRLWQADGGTIGGQSSRGHGRLRTSVYIPASDDQDALCAAYGEHVDGHAAECVDFLKDVFTSSKTGTAKKAGRGKPKELLPVETST